MPEPNTRICRERGKEFWQTFAILSEPFHPGKFGFPFSPSAVKTKQFGSFQTHFFHDTIMCKNHSHALSKQCRFTHRNIAVPRSLFFESQLERESRNEENKSGEPVFVSTSKLEMTVTRCGYFWNYPPRCSQEKESGKDFNNRPVLLLQPSQQPLDENRAREK